MEIDKDNYSSEVYIIKIKAAWSDFISDFLNAFKRYGYATYVHNKR